VSGFADGVVSVLVLVIFGAVLANIINEWSSNAQPKAGQTVPLLSGLSNLWGKALSYMFGG
jgi:hypothetical protein